MTNLEKVPVTKTAESLSNREIATAVIADKLGIPPTAVTDSTSLGEAWREIAMVVAFKTGQQIISNVEMSASDLFMQL